MWDLLMVMWRGCVSHSVLQHPALSMQPRGGEWGRKLHLTELLGLPLSIPVWDISGGPHAGSGPSGHPAGTLAQCWLWGRAANPSSQMHGELRELRLLQTL